MTLTKVAKIAVKSGTPQTVFVDAAIESGYTRQGAFAALRHAGVRTRKERSDKGKSLRNRLEALAEMLSHHEQMLRERDGGSSSGK